MAWDVVLVEEVNDWFLALDQETSDLIIGAVDQLADQGPALRAPLVKRIHNSKLHNLKELRPGSVGHTEVRILFVFDPGRQAVLLIGGDKAGRWRSWYTDAIKTAEHRYQRWLDGDYSEKR